MLRLISVPTHACQVLRQLPLDGKQDNRPRMVQGAVFTRVPLQPLNNPQLVAYSADALRLLDLTPEEASNLPVQQLNYLPVSHIQSLEDGSLPDAAVEPRCSLLQAEQQDFAEFFAGNKLLNGSEPAAQCYCGFQFGLFSGQLGDGAAMYLGEVSPIGLCMASQHSAHVNACSFIPGDLLCTFCASTSRRLMLCMHKLPELPEALQCTAAQHMPRAG